MSREADPVELVCVPSAIPSAERARHFALGRELFQQLAQQRQDLENGYALRFRPSDFDTVARFVANERKCCPFLTFQVTVEPDGGAVWLRITGPAGTRAVLQAELNLAGVCGCQ